MLTKILITVHNTGCTYFGNWYLRTVCNNGLTVGSGQADTSLRGQNGQKLSIFAKIPKNVSLSGQNGNFSKH
jgi:hypothetical protein